MARGPKWPRGDMSDGGPGGLGTVMELAKSSMTVSVCLGVCVFFLLAFAAPAS